MSKASKHILTILISLFWLTASGQQTTHDCRHDKDPKLSKCELDFFEAFFSYEVFKMNKHHFVDKKFAFLSAGQLMDKDEFFEIYRIIKDLKDLTFSTMTKNHGQVMTE